MERALPEAGLLRHLRDHLRLDQVRGKVVHRAHQRQEHAGHVLRVVPRWENGTDMLPGEEMVAHCNCEKGKDNGSRKADPFMAFLLLSLFATRIKREWAPFRIGAPLKGLVCCHAQLQLALITHRESSSSRALHSREEPFTALILHAFLSISTSPQDGFVLVGSVAGQRYWSTMIPGETITSGTWAPDDRFVYLGTTEVRDPKK